MKRLYLLYILFLGLSFTNCSTDDSETPFSPDQSVEKVDYYIKYKVKCASRYSYLKGVTVATDKGTSTLEFKNKSSWEQTYGPVTKGFKASIKVYGLTSTVEIHCCRGQEPFALKAITNGQANDPSLEYTIDY